MIIQSITYIVTSRRMNSYCLSALVIFFCMAALYGCTTVREIRVENISSRHFTKVSIAGQDYGDIGPGETSDYRKVRLIGRYAALKLHVDGIYRTGQTLNFGAWRFTYQIGVADLSTRQLTIDIIRDDSP